MNRMMKTAVRRRRVQVIVKMVTMMMHQMKMMPKRSMYSLISLILYLKISIPLKSCVNNMVKLRTSISVHSPTSLSNRQKLAPWWRWFIIIHPPNQYCMSQQLIVLVSLCWSRVGWYRRSQDWQSCRFYHRTQSSPTQGTHSEALFIHLWNSFFMCSSFHRTSHVSNTWRT